MCYILEKCRSIPVHCMALSGQSVPRNQTVVIVANGGSPTNILQLDMGI